MSDLHNKLRKVSSGIRVLYAEDNAETRSQYENIFKLLFKEVNSVQNGAIALEEYKKKNYDLVITDLTMPHMDGVSLIEEILKINPSQHVIIMTAHNTDENLRSTIDFQVDGILLKPIVMEKLFHLLYKVSKQIYIEKKDIVNSKQEDRLEAILDRHQALFLVVVDKFYEILDEFGTAIKEKILSSVEEHLAYFGIEESVVIQLHNDVILCSVDKSYIDSVLESLQNFSDRHNNLIVTFDDLKIYITLSYGVIIVEENSDLIKNSNDFLLHINNVVNEIKEDEQSSFVMKMDVNLEEVKRGKSLNWLGVTLDALEQKTVVPFYQPIVDINTLEKESYEVFARIKDGDKYILPKFFIDLSEKAGILEDISEIIFKKSFEKLSQTDYEIHINVSDSLWKTNDIENYLQYLCSHYDVTHNRIVLDIRNHETIKPNGLMMKALLRLKVLGYKISLKGFATGNINIELLSILRPDYIKINQLLLEKSLIDPNMKNILVFLLDYTKNAGIKSILVEVESEKILEEGRKLGFNYVQGFYIQRPSPDIF